MNEYPTMRAVAERVAEKHRVTLGELRGPARVRRVAHPRQEAFALIYDLGRFSTTQIGGYFGNRDHTTVMHGLRAYAKRQAVHKQTISCGQTSPAASSLYAKRGTMRG